MKGYTSDKIRNVALVGHGGCGKTTFMEAALFNAGQTNRMGRIEDGNTVGDYDKMEIEKGISISTSVVPVEWNGTKINFVDTPGYFDFIGEMKSALRAVEGVILMVDASSGVQVGTEKAWKEISEEMATFIVVNKMDKENINFDEVLDGIKTKFGKKITPIMLPIFKDEKLEGFVDVAKQKAYKFKEKGLEEIPVPGDMGDSLSNAREMLIEAVAETDEELLDKFFNGEEFTDEEIRKGIYEGILTGGIVPVMVCSALKIIGISALMDILCTYVPAPAAHRDYPAVNDKNEDIQIKCDVSGKPAAFVFKTIVDPFVGKISLLKVLSGKLTAGSELFNVQTEKAEKIAHISFIRGKNQEDATEAVAGDIVSISKLQYTQTGHTLCDKTSRVKFPEVAFPEPCLFMAVEPKAKGDEEKISSGLHKLMEEDPSFKVIRNAETHQTLIGGQGDIHIGIITAKLKEKFGVSVELKDQRIAYRETIKGKADVQGKHKKQSGGAGQYGDVHIRFAPSQEIFEFSEELFGGSVPKQYVPAVEKGLRECLEKGVLAGYPVVNIKAVLYDGSYHDVDSNEMAFKIAASLAFKKGIQEAKPILLEPVMRAEISVPDEYMGDVMGDMNKRRGKILGMEPFNGGQKVIAEAPMAELNKYAIILRSMTQARGSFTMKFERYEELPAHLADKVIAESGFKQED